MEVVFLVSMLVLFIRSKAMKVANEKSSSVILGNFGHFFVRRNFMKTAVTVLFVGMMSCVSSALADLTWNSPVEVYSKGSMPAIALKGNKPCIAFDDNIKYNIGYTEDLGANIINLGPANSAAGTVDIAVDSSGNSHLVWYRYDSSLGYRIVQYQAQVNGSFSGTSAEVINDSSHTSNYPLCPHIAIDSKGVHTVWNSSWYDNGYCREKTSSGWGTIADVTIDYKQLGQQIAANGTDVYIISQPRTTQWVAGPYYAKKSTGWTTTYKISNTSNIGYANMGSLAVAWRGNALDVATIDDVTNSDDTTTGRVLLYLDALSYTDGSATPIEVFNDAPSGGNGTASDVTLAIDNSGMHYVIFSAKDSEGTDLELFLQQVDASGNLVGSLQQLTNNDVDDIVPDAIWGINTLHLTWRSGDAVMYMSAVPEPATIGLLALGMIGLLCKK